MKNLISLTLLIVILFSNCSKKEDSKPILSNDVAVSLIIVTVNNIDYTGTINNSTVTVDLPTGSAIPSFLILKTISLGNGATSNPTQGAQVPLVSNQAQITITAQDGITKKSYTVLINAPKQDVTISSFTLNNTSKLFTEPFNGKVTGYENIVLIPNGDVNSRATVQFTVVTNPSAYASSVTYLINKNDGTTANTDDYSITGNTISFSKQGTYRISVKVADGPQNNASPISPEYKIQICSNIPDDNFRAELKKISTLSFVNDVLDTTTATLSGVPASLQVNFKSIKSVEGVKYFKNITNLDCSNNKLSFLNIHTLGKLTSLVCSNNELTSIDIQPCTLLQYLEVASNNLISLNVNGLTALTQLKFNINKITSIDLHGLINLIRIEGAENPLTSVDVHEQQDLNMLQINGTLVSVVDITGLSKLQFLTIHDTPLSNLILSTTPGSYPTLFGIDLPVAQQCANGMKQIKADRAGNITIITYNGKNTATWNFDPLTACP